MADTKLTILPNTKIAKMDAAGALKQPGTTVQYLPAPTLTHPDGSVETLIGMDQLNFMAGKQFDEVIIDPRVEAKGKKLKMVQKAFISTLQKRGN